jgi:uncharacterized protein
VTITGPRQSGKTTLVRRFVRQGRTYRTLDDRATLDAARADPVAFIRDLDRAVIDEVQRAPEILLAIKRCARVSRGPGRDDSPLSSVTQRAVAPKGRQIPKRRCPRRISFAG